MACACPLWPGSMVTRAPHGHPSARHMATRPPGYEIGIESKIRQETPCARHYQKPPYMRVMGGYRLAGTVQLISDSLYYRISEFIQHHRQAPGHRRLFALAPSFYLAVPDPLPPRRFYSPFEAGHPIGEDQVFRPSIVWR